MDYRDYVRSEYKELFKDGRVPDRCELKFYKYKRIKTDKWGVLAVKANINFDWLRAEKWCKENCKGQFAYWGDNWMVFELKQDAFLFKLNF